MTDAVACAACGRELLRGLDLCFDCDLGNPMPAAPPRIVRRFRWNDGVRDPSRLGRALATLCPALTKEDVSWLAAGKGNELVAEVTPEQDKRLGELFGALAPTALALVEAPPPEAGVRFYLGGRVREKLGATLLIGGLGVAFGVPLVPLGAFVTTALLVARMPRSVSKRAVALQREVDALLGTFSADVMTMLRSARLKAQAPAILGALHACVATGAEVAVTLRRNGAHLEQADARTADEALGTFLKACARCVATSGRADDPYRTEEAAVRKLNDAATRLAGIRASAPAALRPSLEAMTIALA